VRLDGPEEALVLQAMQIDQIDEDEARRLRRNSDRARMDYVKHFYQADPRDPRPCHLVLKSTALETCVELIVAAARARAAEPAGRSSGAGHRCRRGC